MGRPWLDYGAAPFDLLGRDENLPHVLVGLAEMLLQLEHPLMQALEVVHEEANLGMNLVGGLAYASVLLDRSNDMDGEHQQRGRHDDDLGAERLLYHVVETLVQFGVDRFGWHEHQREILGLTRNEVFLGNIRDVPAHVRPQPGRRLFAFILALGVAETREGLERKFRIDYQRALIRQENRTIRSAAVGEHELELVATLRQSILDDDFHAALAEGAALLLVGKHALQ